MARFKELVSLRLKEVETTIAQAELLLQKTSGGQSGELKTAGNLVENYMKQLLADLLPGTLRLSSGYIVTPDTLHDDKNLAQHDVLIVSQKTPPIFSIVQNTIEIVPVESLVGIIEVKKNLSRRSLKEASKRLKETYVDTLKDHRNKQSKTNSMNAAFQTSTLAPLLGIVSLTKDENIDKKYVTDEVDFSVIDFIWSLKGGEAYHFGDQQEQITETVSRIDLPDPSIVSVTGTEPEVFAKLSGLLRLWLAKLASNNISKDNINRYYQIWEHTIPKLP